MKRIPWSGPRNVLGLEGDWKGIGILPFQESPVESGGCQCVRGGRGRTEKKNSQVLELLLMFPWS